MIPKERVAASTLGRGSPDRPGSSVPEWRRVVVVVAGETAMGHSVVVSPVRRL